MSAGLVLMGEGDGDVQALPVLTKRLISEMHGWDVIHLDRNRPFEIGDIYGLAKDGYSKWIRLLSAALTTRPGIKMVLTVLDGDAPCFPAGSKEQFCASTVAKDMVANAISKLGAGNRFSLAVVFACQEYESWLIAGIDSLPGDLELAPRDAKKWLVAQMETGYRASRDQVALTEAVELNAVRKCNLRSFRRLEHAIQLLIEAQRRNEHIATPS
jgi:hypothetical protein